MTFVMFVEPTALSKKIYKMFIVLGTLAFASIGYLSGNGAMNKTSHYCYCDRKPYSNYFVNLYFSSLGLGDLWFSRLLTGLIISVHDTGD